MQFLFSKRGITVVLLFLALAVFILLSGSRPQENVAVIETDPRITIIGISEEGRAIESYGFGDGKIHLLFIGGIHGGYEWNSVILAYEVIDYLTGNPERIPENLTVSVIPSLNPDGVYKVIQKEGRFSANDVPKNSSTESARFNANDVDLNRNFDCNWQAKSTWRGNTVSAGDEPFSESESKAFRDFVVTTNPVAVVFWHSQAGAVYSSACNDGVLVETNTIMKIYADASGYPAAGLFDAYKITGDAEGWLASIQIPSITIELTTHETTETEKNLAGVKALIEYYKNTSK
jgi:hypothetical protein